jgi:hypothetical protein
MHRSLTIEAYEAGFKQIIDPTKRQLQHIKGRAG